MNEYLQKLRRQRDALDKAIAEEEARKPAIGSLDWAIQRMREGEKIFRPDWADKTARISMEVENKITWESDALGITIMDMRKWDSRILGEYRNSGWQLYKEPEQPKSKPETLFDTWQCPVCGESISAEFEDSGHPRYNEKHLDENLCFAIGDHMKYSHTVEQPKYKVGDWVDCKDIVGVHAQCKVLEIHKHNVILGCKTGHRWSLPHNNIIRKLSHSEIIVMIGCLSGTVRPVSTNGIHIWVHLIGVDDKIIATIRISSLDPHTRELVEGLLKAQEEEK